MVNAASRREERRCGGSSECASPFLPSAFVQMSKVGFMFYFLTLQSSVPRIGVSLEKDFDVAHRVDERVESLVCIEQERATWNDEHPVRVPDRATDEAA